MRAAHRRDGAALTRFLAWLDPDFCGGHVTEMRRRGKARRLPQASNNIIAARVSIRFRARARTAPRALPRDPHHQPAARTGQLYLLDSGGQYLDGTTDVTRTIALGARRRNARPLHARAERPYRTGGDPFSRRHHGRRARCAGAAISVEAGCDYSHGTGHGVGCYLGVHEGPQGISKRNKVPLRPGMVVSNEPGYYKAGALWHPHRKSAGGCRIHRLAGEARCSVLRR